MKMRDAAEVTLSLMGVYRIVQAALNTPPLVYLAYIRQHLVVQLAIFAANLAGGLLLVLLAGRIADWMARRSASQGASEVELRLVSPEGLRFCLRLVGINVLLMSPGMLASWKLPLVIVGALTLALGIYMTCGGAWLARFAWGKSDA